MIAISRKYKRKFTVRKENTRSNLDFPFFISSLILVIISISKFCKLFSKQGCVF